jgi:hypothetical protein
VATAGSWARSNDLARKFPHFPKQKAGLTPIAVVVDIAEFEVEDGEATWVYLDDCLGLARRFDDAFLVALSKKGYPIKAQPILSVGHGADTTKTCRVFTRWTDREQRPSSASPVSPPFYADSTLHPSPSAVSVWRAVVQQARRPKSPKRGAPPRISEASGVRDVIGADYVLLAVGLGTHNVEYRDDLMPPVTTPSLQTPFDVKPRKVAPSPYPGSTVSIALIDCRDGTVLWADDASDIRAFSAKRMDDLAEDFVAQMP